MGRSEQGRFERLFEEVPELDNDPERLRLAVADMAQVAPPNLDRSLKVLRLYFGLDGEEPLPDQEIRRRLRVNQVQDQKNRAVRHLRIFLRTRAA